MKKIAILTRNELALKILSVICSRFQPVVVINQLENGYEREKLLKLSQSNDDIILIVDSRMNIIDLKLYYYDYVIIFDNGLSLNKHFVYKPKNLIGQIGYKTVIFLIL